MEIPAHFFRSTTITKLDYTNEPTGNIDFERYLSGLSFWVKPEQKTTQPKKIILSPELKNNWISFTRKLFDKFIAGGFEFFAPESNSSNQISYKKITDMAEIRRFCRDWESFANRFHFDSKSVMQTFPFKSPDDFIILDDVELYKLTDQRADNEVYVSDILYENLDQALVRFKQAGMVIVKDINKKIAPHFIDKTDIKIFQFPDQYHQNYDEVQLDELTPASQKYVQENLMSLEQIQGQKFICAEMFKYLIESCPNLQEIEARIDYNHGRLPCSNRMKVLFLTVTAEILLELDDENLLAFLNKFPNLELLAIYENSSLSSGQLKDRIGKLGKTIELLTDPIPIETHAPRLQYDSRQNLHRNIDATLNDPGHVFSQSLINFKLKSYLEQNGTEQQQKTIIPLLKQGICQALADIFYTLSADEWHQFIQALRDWDLDYPEPIPHAQINILLQYIDINYLSAPVHQLGYLGDGINTYLSSFKSGDSSILVNPFHAIALKKVDDETWMIYDPNYRNGVKTIKTLSIDTVLTEIKTQIGPIVSVIKGPRLDMTVEQKLQNINDFFEHGGLHAIVNYSELKSYFLSRFKTSPELSESAWDGLMLQNMEGIPCWLLALSDASLFQFTEDLIAQYPQKYDDLKKSLENMQKVLGRTINQTEIMTSTAVQQYIHEYRVKFGSRRAGQALVEAKKTKIDAQPDKLMAFELTHLNNVEKTLIQAHDSRALQGLSFLIRHQAVHLKRPVFIVESPNDLQCVKSWIKKDASAKGTVSYGRGGPLYHFLETNKDKHPLLIINYDKFDKQDVIRLNAILDKPSMADDYPLPPQTQIIALQNPTLPHAYVGEDFYSRFDKKEQCLLESKQLKSRIPDIPFQTSASGEAQTVDLYHGDNFWRKILLGHWLIVDGNLQYQSGALNSPLPETLIIKNGPWQSAEFTEFWEKALFNGFIEHEGEIIVLPQGFQIVKQDGYAWQMLSNSIVENREDRPILLNPSNFSHFFQHQDIHQNLLRVSPGFIAEHTDNILPVYVTRDITDDQWAQLLTKCQQASTQIAITLAPGVNLPEPLRGCVHQQKQFDLPHAQLVKTNDMDASAKLLSKPGTLVIDISELSMADLWCKIESDDALNRFRQSDGVLKSALDNSQITDIILTGSISPHLQDGLASILINPSLPKKITLCVQAETSCGFLAAINQHISVEVKKTLVGEIPTGLDLTQAFVQLQARVSYARRTGLDTTQQSWQGIESLEVPHQFKPLDLATSTKEAQDFQQARLDAIDNILKVEPYVFLTGLSGVGKTTFVQKELSKKAIIYHGEHQLKHFVTDARAREKILFIDEANLKPTDWTIFEGLYQRPPYLIIDSQMYPVSENHKIVFAGNPCNYGDERKVASFFARHGNCLIFDPLPAANLYEDILKPCLDDEPSKEEISQALIERYQYLIQFSKTELLVSPRELQMIALLTVAYHKKNPESNILQVTQHFAHEILFSLVPINHQQAYLQRFAKPQSLAVPTLELDNYLITPSREPACNQLRHCLNLREFRQLDAKNPAQQFGGLGGVIIEGEPGIGKSEMVLQTLVSMGFKEGKFDSESQGKVFYRIPVSMSTKDKEALLLKAFDEGAVVIVDEINSAPMMERLLNDLLMGKTPDQRPAKKPGFTLIGTQNPISMGGRQEQSTALSRRLQTIILPDYPKAEKLSILTSMGVDKEIANRWTDETNTSMRSLIRRVRHLEKPINSTSNQVSILYIPGASFFSVGQNCLDSRMPSNHKNNPS